ncbi:MAG: phage holin family protein [Opitutales bacterium]
MKNPYVYILQSWLLIAIGVLVSAHIVPGISYNDTPTLILVVVLLSLLNAFLKPLLLLFTLPFIVLTFGLGILLINAFLLYLVGALVPGFEVIGFWSAFLGAIVISLVTLLVNMLIGGSSGGGPGGRRRQARRRRANDDDIIDI